MRAPELQFIDQLEIIKNKLIKQEFQPHSLFSVENIPAFFSEEMYGKVPSCSSIQTAYRITRSIIGWLIESPANGKFCTEEEVEKLVTSLCSEYPESDDLFELVFATFAYLSNFLQSIEDTCEHYGLTLPEDITPVVLDFTDSDSDLEFDQSFSLFELKEMAYLLDIMELPLDKIINIAIKEFPYFRHIQMSDEIIRKIEHSRAELNLRLTTLLDATIKKITVIINKNSYTDTITTIPEITKKMAHLLEVMERDINAITKNRLSSDKLKEVDAKFEEYQQLFVIYLQIMLEFEDISVTNHEVQAYKRANFPNQFMPRLTVIENLLEELLNKIHNLQIAAAELTCDMGLQGFLADFRRQTNFSGLSEFENHIKLAKLRERLDAIREEKPSILKRTHGKTQSMFKFLVLKSIEKPDDETFQDGRTPRC